MLAGSQRRHLAFISLEQFFMVMDEYTFSSKFYKDSCQIILHVRRYSQTISTDQIRFIYF